MEMKVFCRQIVTNNGRDVITFEETTNVKMLGSDLQLVKTVITLMEPHPTRYVTGRTYDLKVE